MNNKNIGYSLFFQNNLKLPKKCHAQISSKNHFLQFFTFYNKNLVTKLKIELSNQISENFKLFTDILILCYFHFQNPLNTLLSFYCYQTILISEFYRLLRASKLLQKSCSDDAEKPCLVFTELLN